jgi:hypothetical protein
MMKEWIISIIITLLMLGLVVGAAFVDAIAIILGVLILLGFGMVMTLFIKMVLFD